MDSDALRGAERQQVERQTPVLQGGRVRAPRWAGRVCFACGARRPLFFYRGAVKADRDHNLCFECYRAELNRLRARRLSASAVTSAPVHPRPAKHVADRAALLADIAARRRRAQMLARLALDAPEVKLAAEPLAS